MKKAPIIVGIFALALGFIGGVMYMQGQDVVEEPQATENVFSTQSVRNAAPKADLDDDVQAYDTSCHDRAEAVWDDCTSTEGMTDEDCNSAIDDEYEDCMGRCGLKISTCFEKCLVDGEIDDACLEDCAKNLPITSSSTKCTAENDDDTDEVPVPTSRTQPVN